MKTTNKVILSGIFLATMLVLAFIAPSLAQAQSYQNNYNNYNLCTGDAYQRCVGNSDLYWYDSCGNKQDLFEYCPGNCINGTCGGNKINYNYNNCTFHAYKQCYGNAVYWYDSCGTQEDFYYSCNAGQTCQYGQCSSTVQQYVQPGNNYISHYQKSCYGISLYWYDSRGAFSGLYKSCADNNSCTLDACSGDKCQNTLKCDGSTCAAGSADYNTYCATNPEQNQNHCGNGLCESTLGETNANCAADCKISATNNLSVSFFAKQNSNSNQWQKTTEANPNSQVYFMISVANNSTAQLDNVNVSANIPGEITSLGNLQLNGVPVSGDIISGINIGSISPTGTKSLTFEGKTQAISTASTKQATATSNASGAIQSDSVSINFNTNPAAAAVSKAPAASGFWGFLSRWYLWILAGLVLVFLFVIVFRRLSSET